MIDNCEPEVISAFQKDGWKVDSKPHAIRTPARSVYADLRLRRGANGRSEQIIILEVKCFSDPKYDLQELYTAVGQYLFYQTALQRLQDFQPLYLVIPAEAFARFEQDVVVMTLFRSVGIKLVIIDIKREEVVRWLN